MDSKEYLYGWGLGRFLCLSAGVCGKLAPEVWMHLRFLVEASTFGLVVLHIGDCRDHSEEPLFVHTEVSGSWHNLMCRPKSRQLITFELEVDKI